MVVSQVQWAVVTIVITVILSALLYQQYVLPMTTSAVKVPMQKKEQQLITARPPQEQCCMLQRGESGKWVLDWAYANRSHFPCRVSRFGSQCIPESRFTPTPDQPFRQASAWRWQDYECPVQEMTHKSMCLLTKRLNITRILLVGDSLTMHFQETFLSIMGVGTTGRDGTFPGRQRQRSVKCFSGHTLNVLYFRRSSMDDILELNVSQPVKYNSFYKEFVTANPDSTVILANFGSWIYSEADFRVGFDLLMEWANAISASRKVFFFFRPTIPGHKDCFPKGRLWSYAKNDPPELYNWTFPMLDKPYESYEAYNNHTTRNGYLYQWGNFSAYNEYAKSVIVKEHRADENKQYPNLTETHWLNVYNSTVLRKDGHVGYSDCLHYAMPGPLDWWAHFLYSHLLDLANSRVVTNQTTTNRTTCSWALLEKELPP